MHSTRDSICAAFIAVPAMSGSSHYFCDAQVCAGEQAGLVCACLLHVGSHSSRRPGVLCSAICSAKHSQAYACLLMVGQWPSGRFIAHVFRAHPCRDFRLPAAAHAPWGAANNRCSMLSADTVLVPTAAATMMLGRATAAPCCTPGAHPSFNSHRSRPSQLCSYAGVHT